MLAQKIAGPAILPDSLIEFRHQWEGIMDETLTALLRLIEKASVEEIAKEIYVEGATPRATTRVRRLIALGIEKIKRHGKVDSKQLDEETLDVMRAVLGLGAEPEPEKEPTAAEGLTGNDRIIERVRLQNIPLKPRSHRVVILKRQTPSIETNRSTTSGNGASLIAPLKKRRGRITKNGCPRCRGATSDEEDAYGKYSTCMVCGYHSVPLTEVPIDLLEEEENHQGSRRRQPTHGLHDDLVHL